jgi:hypothetical protein
MSPVETVGADEFIAEGGVGSPSVVTSSCASSSSLESLGIMMLSSQDDQRTIREAFLLVRRKIHH